MDVLVAEVVMDPYELEFKDRPRTPKRRDVAKAAPKVKQYVMFELQRFLSRSEFYHEVVPVNIASSMGVGLQDVNACLSAMESDGLVEACQADRSRTYHVLERKVAWNGSMWVLTPTSGDRPLFPTWERGGSVKVANRRKRKRKRRSESAAVRSLTYAEPARWDGAVFLVKSESFKKFKKAAEERISKAWFSDRPTCKKCGAEGCYGGSKGRKAERRYQMRECKDRIVSQVLEL